MPAPPDSSSPVSARMTSRCSGACARSSSMTQRGRDRRPPFVVGDAASVEPAVFLGHGERRHRPRLPGGADHVEVGEQDQRALGAVALEPRHQRRRAGRERHQLRLIARRAQLGGDGCAACSSLPGGLDVSMATSSSRAAGARPRARRRCAGSAGTMRAERQKRISDRGAWPRQCNTGATRPSAGRWLSALELAPQMGAGAIGAGLHRRDVERQLARDLASRSSPRRSASRRSCRTCRPSRPAARRRCATASDDAQLLLGRGARASAARRWRGSSSLPR